MLRHTLRHFAGNVTASPERLAEIEERLVALDRVKRKYGATLSEVIAFGADVAQKLADLEDRDAETGGVAGGVGEGCGGVQAGGEGVER